VHLPVSMHSTAGHGSNYKRYCRACPAQACAVPEVYIIQALKPLDVSACEHITAMVMGGAGKRKGGRRPEVGTVVAPSMLASEEWRRIHFFLAASSARRFSVCSTKDKHKEKNVHGKFRWRNEHETCTKPAPWPTLE